MKIMGQVLVLWLVTGMVFLGCATDQPAQSSTKKMAQAHEQLGNSLLAAKDYQGALKELLMASEFQDCIPKTKTSLSRH